jgi:two-component system chemotaxis response regulator CheY
MSKRVVALVGHCGPDSSYLRMTVSSALKDVTVTTVHDESSLNQVIAQGVDLLLLNRQLDYGYNTDEGVELIQQLRARHPHLKLMLVSNYPDAQDAAVQAGALPGFGKSELGTPRVKELLRAAVGTPLRVTE